MDLRLQGSGEKFLRGILLGAAEHSVAWND